MVKFHTRDAAYKAKRKALSEKYGPRELWSIADQWPLYCGVKNLARSLAIYETLRSTFDVPGHVVEFGSFRGANLLFLAKLLRIHESHSWKMVYCFDSFEGLTEFTEKDGPGMEEIFKGAYKGSLGEMTDMIDLYDMQDEIEIHKGLVEQTLPAVLKEQPWLGFSFVYLDVDLYQATRLILDLVHPRLSVGGVFAFDEWNDPENPGESIAAREFLEIHGDKYRQENVKDATQPSLVLRKLAM